MEKQLQNIDAETARAKFNRNAPVTLKELAVVMELGYSKVRAWQDLGLPIFDHKIFPEDFKIWRQRKSGLVFANGTGAHPQTQAADKSDESELSRGSPFSSSSPQALQPAHRE